MLADQRPNQHTQEERMSTTQQLMLPNDTANYDAPKGGFSADLKVPLLAKLTSGQPTATSSAGGNNAGQGCFEGSINLIDTRAFSGASVVLRPLV